MSNSDAVMLQKKKKEKVRFTVEQKRLMHSVHLNLKRLSSVRSFEEHQPVAAACCLSSSPVIISKDLALMDFAGFSID